MKGEIELVLGYNKEAKKSFKDAEIIIKEYLDYWNKVYNLGTVSQLKEGLGGIENKGV